MNKFSISKKQIKNSINYDWYKYLLTIIGLTLVWYFAFNLKDGYKYNERIQIFTNAELNNIGLTNELEDHFKDDRIGKFSFYSINKEDPNFEVVLEQQGLYNSDVLVVSEDIYELTGFRGSLANLNLGLKEEILSVYPTAEFITSDEETVALKVFDFDDESYPLNSHFSDWATYDMDYYMSISYHSRNAGGLTNKSKDEDKNAIKTFMYLLER